MKVAKYILVGLTFALLAGCIIRDDQGGGPGFDRGQGEFRDQGRGQDRDGDRGDQHFR